MWPFKPKPSAAPTDPRSPGAVDMEMISRPLVIGKGQDPVVYAQFRLYQISKFISSGKANDRFFAEARTEVYSLLHMMRVHGGMSDEDELAHLWRVMVGIKKPGEK